MRCRILFCLALTVSGIGCGTTQATPTSTPSAVIARVGETPITQAEFNLRLTSTLVTLSQSGAQTPSSSADPMLEQVRANVIRGLIIDAVIAREASFRNVAVTDAEVEKEVQQDESAAGGLTNLQTQLAEAGGSLDQLRDEIRSADNEANLENFFAQQRAQQALQALQTGQDFASVAQTYSDDTTSNTKGGDLGAVSIATLQSGDPAFMADVNGLTVGQLPKSSLRDRAGYEILRLDSSTATSKSLHRILVAAPQPYTVKERPDWFALSVLQALAQLCQQNQVTVLVDPSVQPCSAPTLTPAPTPVPRS